MPIIGNITPSSVNIDGQPISTNANITNPSLPVTGSINANITNASIPVTGTVNTISGETGVINVTGPGLYYLNFQGVLRSFSFSAGGSAWFNLSVTIDGVNYFAYDSPAAFGRWPDGTFSSGDMFYGASHVTGIRVNASALDTGLITFVGTY